MSSLKLFPLPSNIKDTFTLNDKQYIQNHNGYFVIHQEETNLPKFKTCAFFEKIGKREYYQAKEKFQNIQNAKETIKKIQTVITF